MLSTNCVKYIKHRKCTLPAGGMISGVKCIGFFNKAPIYNSWPGTITFHICGGSISIPVSQFFKLLLRSHYNYFFSIFYRKWEKEHFSLLDSIILEGSRDFKNVIPFPLQYYKLLIHQTSSTSVNIWYPKCMYEAIVFWWNLI